ncbi:hypothetical protein P3X46_010460 [Hevea brasiliensis]|uniref:Uncharacterized protein n=1 Tax=Hevea brasiliensis TaxID=3981 RepID=A0ABQ9MEI0_HEVBR|nr:uncharacterized protein LOC110653144 [Hevea brasiliensis]KAJ9178586.1 hypothetical protein P3X46_010460 [Hevea brasiliensis]
MEEDIDLYKQLGKGSCYGDDECMWLSSVVSSPSSLLEDYRSSTSMHVFVDDKLLISWLSRLENSFLYLDKGIVLFDDPRVNVNPEEEESCLTALQRTILVTEDTLKDDLMEEKQLTSLLKSCRNATSDSTMNNLESSRSSFEQFCEDSLSCNNFLIPCSTVFDFPSSCSQISDSEKTSFLVSLVNLDGEDSQWISSDTELELDYFQTGFPSPSCKSCEVSLPSSNVSTPSEVKDEQPRYCALLEHTFSDQEVDLEDFDTDEPLFWPSQWKQDWNCEDTWKCFSMSPRKCMTKPGSLQETSSKLVKSKFQVTKMDTKEGCRKRLEFSKGSTASTLLEWKQRSKNNCIKKINSAPSGLRKSNKISMKIVPMEMENDLKERKDREVPIPQSNCSDRDFLEDDITKNGELPIETLLGLGEFDGHEGVDSEFNEDTFSLDESL